MPRETVLRAKVHSVKVPDQDGIKLLLKDVRDRLARLSELWVMRVTKAGARGVEPERRGGRASYTEADAGEGIARIWAEECAKEGREIDWQMLIIRKGFVRSCQGAGSWNAPSLVALTEPQDEQGL